MGIINKKYKNLSNLSNKFINSSPFPHLVLDNFLEKSFFKKITDDKKKLNYSKGKFFKNEVEKNKWISKNTNLPKNVKRIVEELNSKKWLNNLKKLSKIDSLFSTKVGNSDLANYHEMRSDGYLGSHIDHSSDPETGKPHVLNIILYLSKYWKNEWGGSTVFLDSKGKKIKKKIFYTPNRAVIFLHTPYSFHGVSKIRNNKINRSTIYIDYYSRSKNPYNKINLRFNKKWFKHGTCFVLPKISDYFKLNNFYYTKTMFKYKVNQATNNFKLFLNR